jgi:hypothetical protein
VNMKTRSGARGGRKVGKRSRAKLASHSELGPSVPPSAAHSQDAYTVDAAEAIITALTLERQKLLYALRWALHFYDRVAGNVKTDHGWMAKDVLYLKEIRMLAWGREEGESESPR